MKKDVKVEKELDIVEEEQEVFNYSLGAFFGTFVYYIMVGDWRLALVSFVTAVLLPMKNYLLLGLILGFYAGKGWNKKVKFSIMRLITACISVIFFCTFKIIRFHFLGTI